MVCGTGGQGLGLEDGLHSIKDNAIVTIHVFANGDRGNAPVGYAEVGEGGPGEDKGLFALLVGDVASVEKVSRLLAVWSELCSGVRHQ